MITVNFDSAIRCWGHIQTTALQFGHYVLLAIEKENKTIRDVSVALCGNTSLEDRIGRFVMAAEWDRLIRSHPIYKGLYEDLRDWLTTSHMTELQKLYKIDDEMAFDSFEQCFVRDNKSQVTEIKPVEWLRAKRAPEHSTLELYHRFWKQVSRLLPEVYSDLERKGLQATKRDRRRVRILKLALAEFSADGETE